MNLIKAVVTESLAFKLLSPYGWDSVVRGVSVLSDRRRQLANAAHA